MPDMTYCFCISRVWQYQPVKLIASSSKKHMPRIPGPNSADFPLEMQSAFSRPGKCKFATSAPNRAENLNFKEQTCGVTGAPPSGSKTQTCIFPAGKMQIAVRTEICVFPAGKMQIAVRTEICVFPAGKMQIAVRTEICVFPAGKMQIFVRLQNPLRSV